MSVLSWSHVRSCKLIRWRCILQCFFAWSVAVLLVLSREWMGLGVAGMIITSDYGSFPHSLLSTSKLQCICVFVAVQVWRYDTILPGITSQRMLHGSMERHWRLGWYHVLSRCLDHVFSVCILQWLTCKIIMNCFVGYHEVSSPWFPKPSWLCYHRHIRLSDGLPHDPKVTIGPWSLESFAPGTRDTRGGGQGVTENPPGSLCCPCQVSWPISTLSQNRWELRKRNCKNLAGNHWFWFLHIFAILVTYILVSGAYWRWTMLKLQLFTSRFCVDFTFYGTL